MIYKVNGYNEKPTFYVGQATYDANTSFNLGTLIVGTQEDAQNALSSLQAKVLSYETLRFSICSEFVNGGDTTWREVAESDPENTICKVFNHLDGTYTETANKTEAYALNEQRKQDFLKSINLGSVTSLDDLPQPPKQPKSQGMQTLPVGA